MDTTIGVGLNGIISSGEMGAHINTRFNWIVHDNGYILKRGIEGNIKNRITETSEEGERFFILPRETKTCIDKNILEGDDDDKAAFLKFASLDYSGKDIIRFANQYGLLRGNFQFETPYGLQPADDVMGFWLCEICLLKHAVKFWNIRNDVEEIKKNAVIDETENYILIQLKKDGKYPLDNYIVGYGKTITGFMSLLKTSIRQANNLQSEGLLQLAKRSIDEIIKHAVMQYISNEINDALERHPVFPKVIEYNGAFKPGFVPTNLISALWYQFFMAVDGNRRYIKCAGCGEWMDVTDHRENFKGHKWCLSTIRTRRHRGQTENEPRKRGRPQKQKAGE